MAWLRDFFRRCSKDHWRRGRFAKCMWWLYIHVVLPANDIYYFARYRIHVRGGGGAGFPEYGKGKYVSVYNAGGIIRLVSETRPGHEVRITPYQPNHGIMVEVINGPEENLLSCFSLDIKQLSDSRIAASR